MTHEHELTNLMKIMHGALSAEALQVQEVVGNLSEGESLQSFTIRFNQWASVLMYHADVEDEYMTAPLTEFLAARTNEEEHSQLGELSDALTQYLEDQNSNNLESKIKQVAVALHDEQHEQLLEKLEDVLSVLNDEISKTSLVARTRRHLYGKIVALRICQDDHLESEEYLVLPEIETNLDMEQKKTLVNRLLIDNDSDDPQWILDWMKTRSTQKDADVLDGIVEAFR